MKATSILMLVLLFVVLLLLCSCTHSKHNKIVKSSQGELYLIKGDWRCNECYDLIRLDTSELKALK